MAIEFGKGIALAGGFDLGAKAPLDSRVTVATIADRDAHVTNNRAYEGMLVYVEENQKTYQYIADAWVEFGFNSEKLQAEVVNDLTTGGANKILSAEQGKVLKGLIDDETATARAAEEANADAIKVISDDYLKAADKTELSGAIDAEKARAEKAESDLVDAIKVISDDYLKAADKTELQGNINTVDGKVNTLIGEDTGKSARTIANEELAKQLIAEGAAESLDTLQEIAQWIQDHPGDASAMNKAIEDLEALVGTLPEGVTATTVVGLIQELVKAEEDRAKGIENGLDARITTLENANKADGAIGSAIKAAQDKADANEAAIEKLNGDETVEGSVAKAVKDAQEAAATDATNKANQALTDAKTHTNEAIADLISEEGQVGQNTTNIASLTETVNKLDGDVNVEGSVKQQIANAKSAAESDATAKANKALTDANAYTDGKVAELAANDTAQEEEITAIKNQLGSGTVDDRIATAKQEAIDAAAADATTKANAAKDAAIEAAATDAQSKADAAQAAAEATASADATEKADAALAAAKTHVADEIAKLDGSVEVSSAKHVLTGVTEVDGKLTEKTEVELANVAFTGSTDDLVQGAMTLVFDCGTSAV